MNANTLHKLHWAAVPIAIVFGVLANGCGNQPAKYSQDEMERTLVAIVESEWNLLPAKGAMRVEVEPNEVSQHRDSPFSLAAGREVTIDYTINSRTQFDISVQAGDQTIFTMVSVGSSTRINGTLFPNTEELLVSEKEAYRLQPFYVVTAHLFPLSDGLIVTPQAMSTIIRKSPFEARENSERSSAVGNTVVDVRYLVYSNCAVELGNRPRLWASRVEIDGKTLESFEFSDPQISPNGKAAYPFRTVTGLVAGIRFVSTMLP